MADFTHRIATEADTLALVVLMDRSIKGPPATPVPLVRMGKRLAVGPAPEPG